MLHILLIEDENEKARAIAECLLEVDGVSHDALVHVVNAHDGMQALRSTRFDLLILDINVPVRLGGAVEVGGGLRVLNAVRDGLFGVIAPGFVIGLTAYDDAFAKAAEAFSHPLWKLVRFDYAGSKWREQIKSAATFVVAQNMPPFSTDGTTFHATFGIVVGLEDIELRSLLALDRTFVPIDVPHDPIQYFSGTFSDGKRAVDVIIAAAPKMGMPVAAVVATKLIAAFRPRYLIMTGICAGVRGKVRLGDAIVADPCWDWGAGKISIDPKGKDADLVAPYPWRLDTGVRKIAKEVGDDAAFMKSVYDRWEHRKPRKVPKLHIDAVASGAAVVARKAAMDAIRKQHKNLLGVEMELYAVMTASEYASSPRPICLGVKAVCDFGDEKKNDYAHAYAAYVSAEVAKKIALDVAEAHYLLLTNGDAQDRVGENL